MFGGISGVTRTHPTSFAQQEEAKEEGWKAAQWNHAQNAAAFAAKVQIGWLR